MTVVSTGVVPLLCNIRCIHKERDTNEVRDHRNRKREKKRRRAVYVLLCNIRCIHKERDTNEVRDNRNRKREKKRRREYMYTRARELARTHSRTHARITDYIHTYMSLHTYHCL